MTQSFKTVGIMLMSVLLMLVCIVPIQTIEAETLPVTTTSNRSKWTRFL
ncbi:hypothetical protein MGH68_16730 [Erysipelothrix sp. D19-032]